MQKPPYNIYSAWHTLHTYMTQYNKDRRHICNSHFRVQYTKYITQYNKARTQMQ